MKPVRNLPLLAAVCLLAAGRAAAQGNAPRPPYLDPSLSVDRRVDDLLGRMTLEEKVAQMLSIWNRKSLITDAQGRFDSARAPTILQLGMGRIERPSDGHGARAEAEFTNDIQKWVKENTRLGIPVLFHEEALHGLQGAEATSFPQAIALASSWDPDLVQRVMSVVAGEVRARGAQQVLAPVVDVARDPRWGRIEETYGEDPYLATRLGVAAVRGFQGTGPTIQPGHVIATLKHMAGHGQPESGMNVGPAPFGERTMRDVFFPPFKAGVQEAGAKSLMASYNEVDGIPSHENRWMLHDVLRGEWKFDGVIVSDWFGVRELISRHHVAADSAEAAREALAATVDVELPDAEAYPTLVAQVRSGAVPEAEVDSAVRRLLRAKFEMGLFENPYVDAAAADRISGSADNRPLALEAARRSIILLKNQDGLLPLNADALKRVAVIGPHAAEVMLGGYSGEPRFSVSILQGVRDRLGAGATVSYAEGVRITEDSVFTKDSQPHMSGSRSQKRWSADRVVLADSDSNERRIAEAVALARASDVAIVVVGDNEQTSREAYAENHLGDRDELSLVGQQAELVRAVLATGKPTVMVLINGRPPAIPELVERVPAILEGWYPGQEGGTAIAEVLFGDVNPGGKLTVSFPRSVGQLPVYYGRKPSALRGYLFDTTKPLFPFGFGLSYTTFSYSPVRVSPAQIPADGKATVSVDVTNTGQRAGDEVVQFYIRDEVSRATRPVKELRGFQRITLRPGETRTVTFEVDHDALAYHDPDMKWTVEPGWFDMMVGGSSDDVKSARLEVTE